MVYFLWLAIGIFLGGIIFVYLMRRYMIVAHKIDATFDKVNEAVKKVIPQFQGWSFPIPEWQFYKSQISKGFSYDNIKNIVIFFICNSSHANRVLRTNPVLGAIMPCTWAVYETTNGEVYIAKMNIALMNKMYFGTIGEVLRKVAVTEKEMLKKLRNELSL